MGVTVLVSQTVPGIWSLPHRGCRGQEGSGEGYQASLPEAP